MKNKVYITLLLGAFLHHFSFAQAQNPQEYIEEWKDVAVEQMNFYGIPASITLAQGILESGYGTSPLAQNANNHFGIKCHDWKGDTYHQDDDAKDECFRKYEDAATSYIDHSLFLVERTRYAFLFELPTTDYKGWAKGLKKAGYATNPKYPKQLIDLIERYDLNQYDSEYKPTLAQQDVETKKPVKGNKEIAVNSQDIKVNYSKHKVYINSNKTKYVVAGEGDTFYQIAKEFDLNLTQLNRWNDFPKTKDILSKGDKVYIMRKKRYIPKNINANAQGELWEVSQEYGVQLKALERKVEQVNSLASTK